MRRVLIYTRFGRFWHWAQMALVLFMAVTGFEIHGSYEMLGFESALVLHRGAAWALILLTAFAIFWHFTTANWRQYVPTFENLGRQVRYYLVGIFRNEPHPHRKTELSRLNPLQRLVYLGLKIIIFPVQLGSGLLLYYYNDLAWLQGKLGTLAAIHTLGAFAFLAFVIGHVYMTTTGRTPLSNLRAMITGWEELED